MASTIGQFIETTVAKNEALWELLNTNPDRARGIELLETMTGKPQKQYDYAGAANRQLAAWKRQLQRSAGYRCEFGHENCGCTNAPNMDGAAPCGQWVVEEMARRKARSLRHAE